MWKAGPVAGECGCAITVAGCYHVASVLMYRIITSKIAARALKTCSTGSVWVQQLMSQMCTLEFLRKIPNKSLQAFHLSAF